MKFPFILRKTHQKIVSELRVSREMALRACTSKDQRIASLQVELQYFRDNIRIADTRQAGLSEELQKCKDTLVKLGQKQVHDVGFLHETQEQLTCFKAELNAARKELTVKDGIITTDKSTIARLRHEKDAIQKKLDAKIQPSH